MVNHFLNIEMAHPQINGMPAGKMHLWNVENGTGYKNGLIQMNVDLAAPKLLDLQLFE